MRSEQFLSIACFWKRICGWVHTVYVLWLKRSVSCRYLVILWVTAVSPSPEEVMKTLTQLRPLSKRNLLKSTSSFVGGLKLEPPSAVWEHGREDWADCPLTLEVFECVCFHHALASQAFKNNTPPYALRHVAEEGWEDKSVWKSGDGKFEWWSRTRRTKRPLLKKRRPLCFWLCSSVFIRCVCVCVC